MNTPGQKIKEEREKKGWSQQRLADEISRIKGEAITRAAIALWEGGKSKTQKPENFFAAAKALGLSPYWVLDGSGDKYQHTENRKPTADQEKHPPAISIKPPSRQEARIAEIVALLRQTDMEGLAVILDRARDAARDYPIAKQTPASSA